MSDSKKISYNHSFWFLEKENGKKGKIILLWGLLVIEDSDFEFNFIVS